MGKPKLRNLKLKLYYGTGIKVISTFDGTFEKEKRFERILIVVAVCNKHHGLLGIDVWKVDTTKLINSIKVENNTGLLRDYRGEHSFKEKPSPPAM